MRPRILLAVMVLCLAAGSLRAELVEVYASGYTVVTSGSSSDPIPDIVRDDENGLQINAVFDSLREPISQTSTTAVYEALYGYGMVNDVMVPLYGITLEVRVANAGGLASFYLVGTTAAGWDMWVDGYSEDPQMVPSLAFPVQGFVEPDWDYYSRVDIGASGAEWYTVSDQIDLPTFTRISDPPPAADEWHNHAIVAQYGRFTFEFEATPSAEGIDAVAGLSRDPADFFSDMAQIVRFAPSGYIDVRNGSAYQSSQPLRYRAGTPYAIRLNVDLWAKRYSVVVTPEGGSAVKVADNFAFRTEHARANEIRFFNHFSTNGTLAVRNMAVRAAGGSGIVSVGTWENVALPDHGRTFTVQYHVTPSRNKLDAVTGLSNGTANWFDDLAPIVRFAPSGYVDARDDGRYRARTKVAYRAGVTYRVRLVVDLSEKRYSAYVRPAGGTEKKIADNYRFRREQAQVANLDTFVLFSNGGGATEVKNLVLK